MSVPGELERLAALRRSGDLNDDEYAAAKRHVLGLERAAASAATGDPGAPSLVGGRPAATDAAVVAPPLGPGEGSARGEPPEPFVPAVELARGVKALVFGFRTMVLAGFVLFVLAILAWIEFSDWQNRDTAINEARLVAADDRLVAALELFMAVQIVLAVLFLVWLWDLRTRAGRLPGTSLRWGRGWTIGAWVIPVAFIALPYLVMADLARSLGRPRRNDLIAWWLLFVGMAVSLRGLGGLRDAGVWNGFYGVAATASLLVMGAAAWASWVVRDMSIALGAAESGDEGRHQGAVAYLRAVRSQLPATRQADDSTLLGIAEELLAASARGDLVALVDDLAEDEFQREELLTMAEVAGHCLGPSTDWGRTGGELHRN